MQGEAMSVWSWRAFARRSVGAAVAAACVVVGGAVPGTASPLGAASGEITLTSGPGPTSDQATLVATVSGEPATTGAAPIVIVSDAGAVVATCVGSRSCSVAVTIGDPVGYQARHGDAYSVPVVVGAAAEHISAAPVRDAMREAALPVVEHNFGEMDVAESDGWTVAIGTRTGTHGIRYSGPTWASSLWYEFVATAEYDGSVPAEARLWILNSVTGTVIASCVIEPAEDCSSSYFEWYPGPVNHPIVARVTAMADVSGPVLAEVTYSGWYDRYLGIDAWSDQNPFLAGDGVRMVAWPSYRPNLADTDGMYAYYVQDVDTGEILGTCTDEPCEVDVTFYTGERRVRVFIADATDPSMHVAASTSEYLITRAAWHAGLYQVGPVSGSRMPIMAWANQDVSYTNGAYRLYVQDVTTGVVIASCGTGQYCYATATVSQGHLYRAVVAASSGVDLDVQAVGSATYFTSDGPMYSHGAHHETSGGVNPSERCVQGCAGDPVNTVTGEFFESVTDLDAGGGLAFTRSYGSSLASVDSGLGNGWTSNFGMRLEAAGDVGGGSMADATQLVVVQENGSVTPFTLLDGSYRSPARVLASLVQRPDGRFVFERNDGMRYVFSAAGDLIEVVDRNDNTVTLTRTDGALTRVADQRGHRLDLTWDAGRLIALEDQTGREVQYAYDGNGDLVSVEHPDGAVLGYGYDAQHRATSMTQPTGGVTMNVYDADGRVVQQTDPLGGVTAFAYTDDGDGAGQTLVTGPDGAATLTVYEGAAVTAVTAGWGTPAAATTSYAYAWGHLVAVTDPLGQATTYTYDARGNRTSTTDPLGRTTSATYSELNLPLTVTNPAGETTTLMYDERGNLLSSTDPAGATTSYTVNPDGTVASAADPMGATVVFAYDAHGYPAAATDALGAVTTTTYDSLGRLVSSVDPRGNVAGATPADFMSTVGYDPAGRPVAMTDPLGGATATAYDAAGHPVSWTDELGATTTATYDLAGNLVTRTDPAGSTTTWTYDVAGRVATVTDADGAATTYGYDVLGRPVTVTDALGRTTTTEYDAAGRVTSVTTPSGAVTSYGYDAAGQLTAVSDPLGHQSATGYDLAGRPVTATDALGRSATTTYDDAGRVVGVRRADGSVLGWSYDAAGRLTGSTDASGAMTGYGYDAAGRRVFTTDTAGRTTWFGYDEAGNVTSTTYPDGGVVARVYDALSRLVGVDYSDATPDEARVYDAASRLISATAGSSTTTYAYDTAGRVSQVSTDGAAVGYAWTDAGLLDELTYPGGQSVGYGRDVAGQLTQVRDWAGREYGYTWTDDGQVASLTYPNGVVTDYGYDQAGQVLAITTVDDLGAQMLALAYGYDDAGQLTTQSTDRSTGPRAPPAVPVLTSDYTWDLLGRIDEVTGAQGGSFGFTTADQIATLADGRILSYDAAGQATSLTVPGTGGNPEQVTAFGYDQRGNRLTATSDGVTIAHTYDLANRLTSVTDSAGTTSYGYEASGLRSTATTGASTERYVWDTLATVPTLLGNADHLYVYGVGSTPLAQVDVDTGQVDYLHTDLIGSVRTTTDTDGTVTGDADYDPYGTPIEVTITAVAQVTRFGFAGQYTDPTGYLYLRARSYDPTTAQFLTRDPLETLTANPYGYTGGNPLQHVDPLGLSECGTGQILGGQSKVRHVSLLRPRTTIRQDGNGLGFCVSGSAGFLVSISVTLCGVSFTNPFDLRTYKPIGSATMGWGTPGISIDAGVLATNAGSVEQLSGESYNVGASVGEGLEAGVDASWGKDGDGNTIWTMFGSVGVGVYAPFPAELHGGWAETGLAW